MAYRENWASRAANEIIDKCDVPTGGGRYRASVHAWITSAIARYSPFKEDTAYMEIPRCDSCKHWARGTILVTNQPSRGGFCRNPELRAFGGQQILETAEDFGCMQWEKK
jgi:hypothetical protein